MKACSAVQPSETDLSTKDVYTILAEMMHKQASQAKKQDALKKDVQNVRNACPSDRTCLRRGLVESGRGPKYITGNVCCSQQGS